ncbi:MAG TPA: ChbG/HpnK family deacetylase, partial [Candidatus Limnocylindria bacterium]|nr:ChbG/HpnK family deacetylase [Candidatus Limnocylindria bacterium]
MSVVVTADDLGLSPAVTRGILEAHRRGVVRSTSLLVTYPGAEEAAALARAEPELEIGLHIDLVGGRPVSDPAAVPSLCDEDG